MSEENKNNINIVQSSAFDRIFKRLSEHDKDTIDTQIDVILDNPKIGEQKRGDLTYLWVHKFKLDKQLVLLGYNFNHDIKTLALLSLGSHQNFYDDAKHRRNADLKLLTDK